MITIRTAVPGDAESILDIYAFYVENTALTFEYTVPTVNEFRDHIKHTTEYFPYLIAEVDGRIVGYCYAGKFHERAAYAWDAEISIYLKNGCQRQGIGRQLYSKMEEILKEQGIVNIMAIITSPADELSDCGSMQFHEKMGYSSAGRLENYGYKFGRWYSVIYMSKMIGEPSEKMQAVSNFDAVREKFNL